MKTIIFDFDGTLADTINLSVKCVNLLAEKYDLEPIANIKELRKKSIKDIIKENLELPWYKVIFLIKEVRSLLEDNLDEIKLFSGIKPLLNQLKKNYTLGIVTSNNTFIVKEVLKKYSLDMFSFIHSDGSLRGKGRIIKKIIQKQNLKPEETIYIGDEVRDIIAIRKAGIKIISVTWGFNSKEILLENKPDFLVDKPKDMLALFKSNTIK
jgi:HAD superfamily hydrolase (TIGR01549 family)